MTGDDIPPDAAFPVVMMPQEKPADVFESIHLGQNFIVAVNMLGLLARRLGGQVDFTAEDMASIAGSVIDVQYNNATNVMRLQLRDLKAPAWDRANVNYAGRA